MENAVKRIGVLTSGGDAPGMNAAIRSVVRSALSRGIEVVGIRRGWQGLINGDFVQMDSTSVSRIVFRTPVSAAKASFRQQSRSASSDESAYSPDAYFISHRLTLPSDRSMTRSIWAPRRPGSAACVRQE